MPTPDFTAPADRNFTEKLQKITGLEWAAKEITRRRYEKFARLALLGGGVKVTEKSFPELWQAFSGICSALEIALPDFFIGNPPGGKTAVIGEEKPFIVLPATFLNEKKFWRIVLAQVLGHISCNHLPYLMMRNLATAAADNLGILKSAVSFPRMLLEEWHFAATLSTDRAALWVTDDLPTILEYFCAQALPENPAGRLTAEALLAQGEEYLALYKEIPPCPLFHTWSTLYFQMPRYAVRAVELKKWAESPEYRALRGHGNPPGGESPAYWGAFAGAAGAWESVNPTPEDPETADFLFGLNRSEWLYNNAQNIAAEAENLARTGMQALSNAAEAFLKAWK